MLQSEQAWAAELYNGMEFNTREEVEDLVSAMEQMEPDQLLRMEPLLRLRAIEDSPHPLMRFCPMSDRWRSVYGEQTGVFPVQHSMRSYTRCNEQTAGRL